MNFSLLYIRIRDIIVNPSGMWMSVRDEERSVNEVRLSLLLPLAILISVAGVIGTMIFTYNGLSVLFPVVVAVKYFLTFLITVEFTSRAVTEITYAFTPARNFNHNYKLVLYSLVPFMVAMVITRIFSSLLFLNLAGIYGVYITYLGVAILAEVPKALRIRYTVLIFITTLVFYLAVNFIINSIFDGLYYAFT